jgi:hypothetical protein
LRSQPPDTTRLVFRRKPTALTGVSWTPSCGATLLGGAVPPSDHKRTALSEPPEKTVEPSAEKQVSKTDEPLSCVTVERFAAKMARVYHCREERRNEHCNTQRLMILTLRFGIGSYLTALLLNFPTRYGSIPVAAHKDIGIGTPREAANAVAASAHRHTAVVGIQRSSSSGFGGL